ncbi:hypothetical protein WICMUC_000132 [Wickerhamomyces mucosus]|uniref:Uncharacterized protein n=1 Tax=Wickerhamomyces mucosus TaxID=1378264 RepID=A0A9P8TJN9_9ASCO|nr:hypothetical protein WICMUC_000132 [Wickerhamomyces mucosus]
MFVNKFPYSVPISLNTNMSQSSAEDDFQMMDSLTPVSTPTEQINNWFNNEPPKPRYGRTESVSSIASSISNFPTSNEINLSQFAKNYTLTPNFEQLLIDTYQNYQLNPTITPFSSLSPPSGIVNRVSKDALSKAMELNMDIGIDINNYSLTIIRQKLIQLCGANNEGERSRNSSVSSSTNIPMMNLSNKFNNLPQSNSTSTPTDKSDGCVFSFEAPEAQFQPAFQSELNHQQHLQQQQQQQQQGQSPSLQAEFPEGLFNATSNRKRESLRLKRSGNKITYI